MRTQNKREKNVNSGSNRDMSVKISVLGGFTLVVDGESVLVSARKSKALLAWLVCHEQRPQTREQLATLLWADRSSTNAKASLRQTVAGLRKVLPAGCLTVEGEYIGLDESAVETDIQRFLQWSEFETSPELAAALSHYGGELLDGLNVRSDNFEEWLLLERESLHREALTAFQRLFSWAQESGEVTEAIAVGAKLLNLDPLQEDVHRNMMRLYAQQGQLGSVQRQFQLCREALQRELNVAPAPQTVALLTRLGEASAHSERSTISSSHSDVDLKNSPSRDSFDSDGSVVDSTEEASGQSGDRRAALPNIVVLPFQTRSAVSEHEYLADGMTEELINLLAQCANWQVAARNLSFQYRDKQVDVRRLSEEIGAAYAVEGSVSAMGERVRISVALVSTADGTQIWSDRFDRPMLELFDVQDEVVHAIFRTLKNRLGFAERERVRRTPKISLDAWGLLIKAMQVNVVGHETHLEQLALVREALTVEPNYPRAHAYLAMVLFTSVGRGASRRATEDAAEAAEHAEAALSASPADPVVLKMCAGGLAAVGQAQRAMKLAERAFEITGAPDPLWVAVLMWNGRIEEAQQYCTQILNALPSNMPSPPGELRPLALMGNLEMLAGNYQAALESALQDQRANPGNFFAHVNLANVYGLLNRPEEARDAWELAKTMLPSLTVALFANGYHNVFAQPELARMFSEGLYTMGFE